MDKAAHGEVVTVTYRGKVLAKIVPLKKTIQAEKNDETSIFGLWKDHEQRETVEDYIRDLRKGRQF